MSNTNPYVPPPKWPNPYVSDPTKLPPAVTIGEPGLIPATKKPAKKKK